MLQTKDFYIFMIQYYFKQKIIWHLSFIFVYCFVAIVLYCSVCITIFKNSKKLQSSFYFTQQGELKIREYKEKALHQL